MYQPKSINYSTSTLTYTDMRFLKLCIVPTMLFFNWTSQKCETLARKQRNHKICNYGKKKLKTRSTKIKKPLVQYETITDISL